MSNDDQTAPQQRSGETRLWHPFADMGTVRHSELVLVRGEGVWLWDDGGRRYIDASASLWYANVGHGRREIADAVAAQLSTLEAYGAFGDLATEPALALAARLADRAPVDDARVFFTTGGGEAIDSAAKIARQHFSRRGNPNRMHLISRVASYHGTNGFGTSLGGIEANRAGYGVLIPHASYVPYDSVDALDAEIRRVGADNVAAFFAEPIIGAGGVLGPPDGYLEGVADVCASHGVLLIVDAVICGFGRLGNWYGIERWNVRPDMIVFAKGVTSGYQPLGGVVASGAVAAPFWDEPGQPLRHGATYSAHAACCAAGLATLDIMEREDLLARSAQLEGVLAEALTPLQDHPLVAEVRAGTGLLGAVELTAPAAVPQVYARAREAGVLTRALASAIAVSPPLIVEPEQIELIASTIGDALDATLAAGGAELAAAGSAR